MTKYSICYRFLQNAGVNNSNTENNSKRPISIKNDNIHLAISGNPLHE